MYLEQDFLTNIPLSFFDDSAVFDELSLRLPVSARTGNNTQLLYDALDRCVKIEERAGGSLTSTKQFVWCGTERCEERDASGNVVSQFFGLGQKTSGNSFYYNLDHLGSVREVTNSSGAIVTQVAFSPWGEATLLQGSTLPDFGYAGYYNHGRSGLNLTLYRAYSPGLGRWLSRDPLGESAGVNLYGYVGNNPISFTDRLGLLTDDQLTNNAGQYGPGPADTGPASMRELNPIEVAAWHIEATVSSVLSTIEAKYLGASAEVASTFMGMGMAGMGTRRASALFDVTKNVAQAQKGSRTFSFACSSTRAEFEARLAEEGFTKSIGKGDVSIFEKGATRYTVRDYASNTEFPGPAADVRVNGDPVLKIRLKQ